MGAALLQILKRFCEPAIDKRLGRESDLAILNRSLQQVSDLYLDLFANMLRDHDLKLLLYGNDFHAC